RNLGRTREIVTVLLNHGFGDVVERLRLGRYLRWGRRARRQKTEPPATYTTSQRIRLALEELGPTFVKFGQVVSTRPDLVPAPLPAALIAELETLQEHVPPFSADEARQMLESEFGAPVEKLFARFDAEPIAAGSLAQVHRAWHPNGTPLAVKIRRPSAVRDVE